MKNPMYSLFRNIKQSDFKNTIDILNNLKNHDIDNLRVKDYNLIEIIAIINTDISDEYVNIIDHILRKYSHLITERAYDLSFNKKNYLLIEYLKYYDSYCSDICCGICHSGRMKNLLVKNICLCKNYVHLNCVVNNIKNDMIFCNICSFEYKINEKNITNMDVDLIYFPYNFIYPSISSIGSYIFVTDIYDKFIYAIKFLQASTLKFMIYNCNKNIKSNVVSRLICDDIGGFVDNKYSLKEYMNPYYPMSMNLEKYKIIEDIVTELIRSEWMFI